MFMQLESLLSAMRVTSAKDGPSNGAHSDVEPSQSLVYMDPSPARKLASTISSGEICMEVGPVYESNDVGHFMRFLLESQYPAW